MHLVMMNEKQTRILLCADKSCIGFFTGGSQLLDT